MRNRLPIWALGVVILAILLPSGPVRTQDEAPAELEMEETPAGEPASESLDRIEEIFEGEEEVLAGEGYSYDPGMRRDPFLSLLQRTQLDELQDRPRPEGVPGLLIDEIDLKGIFQMGDRWFAQIQTADKEKSYLVEEGDELFDGEVVAISANEVVFKQMVNDPSIIKPFREVVKKLNPEP
jgi:Tfp pilus assembly protein PilP